MSDQEKSLNLPILISCNNCGAKNCFKRKEASISENSLDQAPDINV